MVKSLKNRRTLSGDRCIVSPDGVQARSAARAWSYMPPMAIEFLNADLEIVSDEDLEPIRAAFAGQGSRFFELYCGQTGEDSYLATFEIHPELECSNDEHREFTAQEKIHAFCDSIAELQETALDVWKRATRRVIDLGYRCDDRCAAFHELLSVDTLRRMESLGIELALTIYPQEIRLQDEPCEAGGAKLAE